VLNIALVEHTRSGRLDGGSRRGGLMVRRLVLPKAPLSRHTLTAL
jgi:hypothetical protein